MFYSSKTFGKYFFLNENPIGEIVL